MNKTTYCSLRRILEIIKKILVLILVFIKNHPRNSVIDGIRLRQSTAYSAETILRSSAVRERAICPPSWRSKQENLDLSYVEAS